MTLQVVDNVWGQLIFEAAKALASLLRMLLSSGQTSLFHFLWVWRQNEDEHICCHEILFPITILVDPCFTINNILLCTKPTMSFLYLSLYEDSFHNFYLNVLRSLEFDKVWQVALHSDEKVNKVYKNLFLQQNISHNEVSSNRKIFCFILDFALLFWPTRV